jgi:tRNA (mo5U34)-methyltransferase
VAVDENGIYWWHSISLPGRVTPGDLALETLRTEFEALRLPDLRGRTLLDIGAWDGFFSFAAEEAGASRVVALDHFVWSLDFNHAQDYWAYVAECRAAGKRPVLWGPQCAWWDPSGLPGKRGFDAASQARGSNVKSVVDDFMTCDLTSLGVFDITLFLGVLYHLREPLTALRRLRRLTTQLAVVETAAIAIEGKDDRPLLEFSAGAEVKNDPTNWFFPNEKAAIALLHAAGFADVKTVGRLFHEQTRPGVTDFRLVLHALPDGGASMPPEQHGWDWVSELDEPLTAEQRRIQSLEEELLALRSSRTFRYTAIPRRVYGSLRRRVLGTTR